jgi:hypothetical protein
MNTSSSIFTYPDVLPDLVSLAPEELKAYMQLTIDAVKVQTGLDLDVNNYILVLNRKSELIQKFLDLIDKVGLAALRNTYAIEKLDENRFHIVLSNTDDIKIAYEFHFDKTDEGYTPNTDSSDEVTAHKTIDGRTVYIREQWDGETSVFAETREWIQVDSNKVTTQEVPVAASLDLLQLAQEIAEDINTTLDLDIDPVSLIENIKLRERLLNRFYEILDLKGLAATEKAGYRLRKSKRFDGVYNVTIYNSPDHIYKEVMTILDGGVDGPLHITMHSKSTIEMVVYERNGTRRRVFVKNTPDGAYLTLMEEPEDSEVDA